MDARPTENAIIDALDPACCSDEDWAACYALNRMAHQEQGTYPMSLTAYRAEHLTTSGGFERRYWVTRVAGSIVAKANLTTKPTEPAASLGLHVDPRYRRRGIARRLAAHVLRAPGTSALQALLVGTTQPVGRATCEALGGKVVLEGAQRFLDLAAVDWPAVERARGEGARRFPGVRLLDLQHLPDAIADAFLSTRNRAWADQPHVRELPEDRLTLEGRRAEERAHELKGWQWRTLVSQEPDGAISGITDTHYDPTTPELVRQHFTGVAPAHRCRGLATWLKAEMLARIRERYPAARRVTTHNGNANAPMLAINRALGFGDPVVQHTYRFDVPDLRARLAGRA